MTIKNKLITSRLFLILSSLLCSVIICELTLRIIYLNQSKGHNLVLTDTYYQPDPDLIYRPAPNALFKMVTDEFNQEAYTNNIGCRSEDLPTIKAESEYRIFFVGDSYTFGHGISKNELTYPARFEKYIQEYVGDSKKINVYNCGVPGYTPDLEYRLTEKRVITYKPDLIIWNIMYPSDLYDLTFQLNWPVPALYGIKNNKLIPYDARLNWLAFQNMIITSTPKWISRSFTVGQLLKSMSSIPFFSRVPNVPESDRISWASQKILLEIEAMKELAEKNNFRLIIVYLPAKDLFTGLHYDDRYTSSMKNIAAQIKNKGIEFVDLFEQINLLASKEASYEGNYVLGITNISISPELFFKKDFHPNEKGADV